MTELERLKELEAELEDRVDWLERKLRVLIPFAEVLKAIYSITPGLCDEGWDQNHEIRKAITEMIIQESAPDTAYKFDIEKHARYRVLCALMSLLKEVPECMR